MLIRINAGDGMVNSSDLFVLAKHIAKFVAWQN